MTAFNHPLYHKLQAFALDDPASALSFSARLRRENGWSPLYTRCVLCEYRRFLFLATVAGHPVTPPDAVDVAWHLHMVYTRSYWDDLCGETLGKPLHHAPTRGGTGEGAKFADWYTKTRESYRTWFESEPPADIWLAPDTRFQPAKTRFVRVNTAENWVIPKRLPPVSPALALLLPLAFGATGSAGVYVVLFAGLFVTFVLWLATQANKNTNGRRGDGSGGGRGDGGAMGGRVYRGRRFRHTRTR